ncbi:glycosyltransferase family 4 protein [Gulosibacter faecalis]|uniref:D-inositol 3-phosphate glycosyltransferase n=1 Tax=Gulosibacter faecalis TaxID=272240 RepID=A0ABW5V262_9MICO|nr:glycosyltransferase family 4 protein [Gulosibacter faecalis]
MTSQNASSWQLETAITDEFAAAWASLCGPGGDPAEFWRSASRLGKDNAGDPLSLRMLTRLALGEQYPAESRFVALLLEANGAGSLAARLTDFSNEDSAKAWQRRRLIEAREHYVETQEAAAHEGSAIHLEVRGGTVRLLEDSDDLPAEASWQDALLAVARASSPLLSPTTVRVEVFDADSSALYRDLALVGYLGNLRIAVIEHSEGTSELEPKVREWVGHRSAELAVFVPHGDGFRLAQLYGRTLQRPAHIDRTFAALEVRRWLEFDWLLEAATAKVFDVPRLFELKSLVESISIAQLPRTDVSILEQVLAFVPELESRGIALERLATVFLDRGDFGVAEVLLNLVGEAQQSSYFQGRINRARFGLAKFEEVREHEGKYPVRKQDQALIDEARAAVHLLTALAAAEASDVRQVSAPTSSGDSFAVTSILHASAPHQSGGYANRAHQLLGAVQTAGIRLRAYTRPGFPDESLSSGAVVANSFEGVDYFRLGGDLSRNRGEYQYMVECLETYRQVLRENRPDVVHLRSTYVSALPGIIAAREAGIPTVYEVSGMWELVYATYGDARRESMRARTVRLENAVLRNADRVVTLTRAMADIINERVTTRNPVEVLPNAVDIDRFRPMPKDAALLTELGWSEETPVIGYAGSVVDYEGLEVLVDALAELRDSGVEFRFVLIGDGTVMNQVQSRIDEHELGTNVLVTGRIPHAEVERYYSIFDICAFPRLSTPATEAVSPLKPFEALASGKAVIVSDVAALVEIVGENERGIVVPNGDAHALADAIRSLIENPDLRATLGATSREWVGTNHTWEAVGGRFVDVLRAARGTKRNSG